MEQKNYYPYEAPLVEEFPVKPHGVLCGSLDAILNEDFSEEPFEL